MRRLLLSVAILCTLVSCSEGGSEPWTDEERALVSEGAGVMRVLTVEDSLDLAVLRAPSCDLPVREIRSEVFRTLAERMLATVTSPEQDGVGIAAPQVGLNRRVIAVQRFDKPGEPFEVYPNGKVETTLRLLALIRLLHPRVLLPATTALGTLHPQGRELGIQFGANVVMPNLSPKMHRKDYAIYDNKICTGEEAAECRACTEHRIRKTGYETVVDRGDYKE